MNGSDVWAAYNVASSLAAVAQFSVQHASNVNGSSADLTLKSYLFGARYSRGNSSRFAPFVQALFGGSHAGTNLSSGGPVLGNTANSLALAAGGGLDISLARHFAVRAFEAEYFRTQFPNGANDRQNNLRLSAGLILNWGKD
jgi:outer membrane immunogenic protein